MYMYTYAHDYVSVMSYKNTTLMIMQLLLLYVRITFCRCSASVTSSTPNTRALLKCKTPERSMTGRMTSRSIENDPVSVRRFCTEKTSEPDYNGGMMSTLQSCISAVIFVVLYMILLETTLCIQYLSYIHVCLSNALPTCDC